MNFSSDSDRIAYGVKLLLEIFWVKVHVWHKWSILINRPW